MKKYPVRTGAWLAPAFFPCLVLATALALGAAARGQGARATSSAASALRISFAGPESLAGWRVTGDAGVDAAKSREGTGGSLRVGPGAKAVLKLRDVDGSGKLELWVYDDGTVPENAKVSRVGPRWGLVQSDGRLLAAGILYASYLGGNEGYTVTASDGRDWFDQLFWLGVNRAPAGWHKWTFDFDAEDGLRVFHNDRELGAVEWAKTRLKGFNAIAIWGDAGKDRGQTIWVADPLITLGGPVNPLAAHAESDPYAESLVAADPSVNRATVIYTAGNAPEAPRLEDLPLKERLSQYGITWTFDKPARVGQFVNGDWYVVGPVTVQAIEPKPLYGREIPRRELDAVDKDRAEDQRVRNGFMVNPPAQMRLAYDSGVRNWFDPSLIQKLPAALRPGDSLVSTISMPKGLALHNQLRNGTIERGVEDSSPIRTAAVLTCVGGPQPPDAFRPAFATGNNASTWPATSSATVCPPPRPPAASPTSVSMSGSPSGPGSAPASSASKGRSRTCHNTGGNTGAWPACRRCCSAPV